MDESGPSKPKWYKQTFCTSWLQDKKFSEWLVHTSDGQTMCKVCDCKFKDPNKGALERHMVTEKHSSAMAAKKRSLFMTSFLKPKAKETVSSLEQSTAKAELLMTGYMAEHRVPFNQANHMAPLFAAMFPDSKIAANMKIKRTKASYIMQDGIAYAEKKSVSSICADNFFSLLIDESTDVSTTQVLAVVVRFLEGSEVKDALLDIVEVENGSAETLYAAVKDLFRENKIPLRNVIGFAADNCATMMGKQSGFQTLLKSDLPNVFVLGCVCHSFALCANHASKQLPSWLETFVKDVCSYFSRSSKRQRDFDLIQKVVKTQEHRILKLCQTRWLSRGQVIARILEQWDTLLLFFQSEASVDKVDGASSIYQRMTSVGTKHMLLFLNYILPKVDRMNVHFQAEQPQIHTLFNSISQFYRELLSLFVREDILSSMDVSEIQPSDESTHRQLSELVLGGRCTAELTTKPLGEKEEVFRGDCKRFLKELCMQIQNRFEFSKSSVLASLAVLDPGVALSATRPMSSLASLALKFPQVIKSEELDDLDDEWRALLQAKEQLAQMQEKPVAEFWTSVASLKDGIGRPKFPTLGRLMLALAVLPHSSACVERVFSEVNMVKTTVTNRLHAQTVANRLLASQHLKRQKQSCYTWSPDQKLIDSVLDGDCYKRCLERTKSEELNVYDSVDPEGEELPTQDDQKPL